MAPTLGEAMRLGASGLGRERWLVAAGLLTTLLRRGLGVPVTAVALFLVLRGAWQAHRLAPFSGEAPLLGAAGAALQPGLLALVVGWSACAATLGWLVRLAFLAGALPTLAGAMASTAARPPRFATGVAWGLPRLLPTAVLGLALEWTGQLILAGVALASLRITVVASGSGRGWLAAAVAAALVLALLVSLLASAVADASLVRTAVRGDGPVEAVLQASSRVLARPAAYLLALLVFGLLSLVAVVAFQAVGGLATGFPTAAPALVTLGPGLMLSALATTVAAALELWWLASLTVMAAREG
jgi:hypothetical protein